MNNRTKNLIIVIVSVIAIIALAMMDFIEHRMLTTGFLGMVVLISGSIIIPSVVEFIKNRKKN